MRLTEPGIYIARDGRRAMSYQCMTGMSFVIAKEGSGCEFYAADNPQTEGEWQRIDLAAVKWPELPPKPPLCYTDVLDAPGKSIMWRIIHPGNAHYLSVVPHPDNDPEAVAMIEAARKEAGDV